MSLSIGLLILRVVIGAILMGHGSQKLFGWFGGHGFTGTTGWLKSQGFAPAWFWALLGALGEFAGGLLLVLGFLTPLGAIAVFASMLMAVIRFHWANGFWSTQGGYEYPFVLMIIGLVIGLMGPGAYSIDALAHIVVPSLLFWVGLVLAIIVVAIGAVSSYRQTAKQAPAQKAA
ncbi:hypothetical protein KDA_61940 [Dictyobacter alpinus]|uniref:DoxX family protein n=1 Tax=Dictyobacter alpinus TaxID=2014873 RepID=A0A402BHE5_9CHLR|nr:DoxX family protein [Dictyobacter alpinus]GCE30710.1 hypothetical protein KDA_61940 [Dictyobacter alpinus]